MTTTATDRDDTLELTLDPSRLVARVHVHDVDRLRTPAALSRALLGAFQAADGQRLLDELEASGAADELLERAERDFAERPGLVAPRVGDVSYDAYRSGRLDTRPGTATTAPPRRAVRVTSDNGYLTITRDQDGALLGVDADAEWLSGARTEYLEAAILQAATGDRDGE
jgi:hypothetical protein